MGRRWCWMWSVLLAACNPEGRGEERGCDAGTKAGESGAWVDADSCARPHAEAPALGGVFDVLLRGDAYSDAYLDSWARCYEEAYRSAWNRAEYEAASCPALDSGSHTGDTGC